LQCPFCSSQDVDVVETRDASKNSTRRRRECKACGKRFTTYEYVEDTQLTVVKKDGRREPFQRDKLVRGVKEACEKRPVSAEQITALAGEIEQRLRGNGEEVPSQKIGEEVMKSLRGLDRVAYIRFASVYKEFKEPEEFEKEVKELKA
jgi:transcriptional repressor NrdR